MIRAILRATFLRLPQPVRRTASALLSYGTLPASVRRFAGSGPARAATAPPSGEDITRPLFDAEWYARHYPDTPQGQDEAYGSYRRTGLKAGRSPSPLFENVRFPSRAHIPQEHLYRVTASPILCRVPPARYLEPYQTKKILHKLYASWDDYFRQSMLRPHAIQGKLSERDLRVTAYMDTTKRRLAATYARGPQDTLVSVVMSVRQAAPCMGDAIASVMMQSYENWELLIIDGSGGQPDVEPVVRSFDDSRITYMRLDGPAGLGRLRNAGIEQASGSVLAYLTEYALWDPDHLLILVNQMHDGEARLSYGAQVMWGHFDPVARLGRDIRSIRCAPYNRSLLENTNSLSAVSLIHQRALLDEVCAFDESLQEHLDWDFVLRLTEAAPPVAVPCLLSHSFAASEETGHVATDAEDRSLRARLLQRSDWSQPYTTTDGVEHWAVSISKTAREIRRTKLQRLPSEVIQILIPNFESRLELEMCLQSIAGHTPCPHRVTVIDNGSSEQTYAALESLCASLENVRLIQEVAHSGFTYAVNRGLAEIAGQDDKVLILNNDTLVTPDWLDELRYVLHKHDNAGMAVPRQVLPAHNRLATVHVPEAMTSRECDINLSANHQNVIDPEFDRVDSLVELSYAPLFCGLIRPETLRSAGLLDSLNGPHFRSDWIFCDVVRRFLKQKIVYTPHSKVYHLQGVATHEKRLSTRSTCASSPADPDALE